MTVKTEGIILSVLKFKDTDAIVKAYTNETGFTTYFIRSLFKSNKNKLKKAYFQPGSILQIVATNSNKEKMEYIKEAVPLYHYINLHTDFDKMNISTFIRQILLNLLQTEQADDALFSFLKNSFIELDRQNFSTDFHIHFLIKLTKYLGIFPATETQGKYFDLINGVFTNNINKTTHFLDIKQTNIFRKVLGTIFATNNQERLTNTERQTALDMIIKYYEIQIESFKKPSSLQVLTDLYK